MDLLLLLFTNFYGPFLLLFVELDFLAGSRTFHSDRDRREVFEILLIVDKKKITDRSSYIYFIYGLYQDPDAQDCLVLEQDGEEVTADLFDRVVRREVHVHRHYVLLRQPIKQTQENPKQLAVV